MAMRERERSYRTLLLGGVAEMLATGLEAIAESAKTGKARPPDEIILLLIDLVKACRWLQTLDPALCPEVAPTTVASARHDQPATMPDTEAALTEAVKLMARLRAWK